MKALRLLTASLVAALYMWSVPGTVQADDYYQLASSTYTWDGTAGNRLLANADYQFDYGDSGAVGYDLPWNFRFYGQNYTRITADTNGNIWLGTVNHATLPDSFPLASTGPVISVWNNDLSSYYDGGVFIERKTAPERVVVHWRSETFADAGYGRNNEFEAVLYADGTIRFDYKAFDSHAGGGADSGIASGSSHVLALNGFGTITTLANRSFRFAPDLTPPTLNPDPMPPTKASFVTLSGSTEAGAVVQVTTDTSASVGDVTIDGATWSCVVSNLAEGENPFTVTATDAARNVTTATVSVVQDLVPPALTVNPPVTPTQSPSQILSGARESGATIAIRIAPSNAAVNVDYPSSTSWECTLEALQYGDNVITVTASDAAGNRTETRVVITRLVTIQVSIQPSNLAADSQDAIQLVVDKLDATGTSIFVEQIIDANRNGQADAGESAIQAFYLTDGVLPRDSNIPGDGDGAADGRMVIQLDNSYLLDRAHAPGKYLFRVSAGEQQGEVPFVVDPVSQAQTLSGTVRSGNVPVAGGLVQLTDKWDRPVAWAVTDEIGQYLFNLKLPGEYRLLPMAPGYAAQLNARRQILLASGDNLAHLDLELTVGTYHLRGRIYDQVTGNGIPGVVVTARSSGFVEAALTDALGNYDLYLPEGTYALFLADDEAGPSGKGFNAPAVSLTVALTTDVVGADVAVIPADMLIRGTVTDANDLPLAGLPVRGIDDANNRTAFTVTASDGSYALHLISGTTWTIKLDDRAAQTLGYVGTFIDGVATENANLMGNDLTGYPIDAWVEGSVAEVNNTPLPEIIVNLRNAGDSIRSVVTTSSDGTYRFGLFSGSWWVRAATEGQGYSPASEYHVSPTAGQTITASFVAEPIPTCAVPAFISVPETSGSKIKCKWGESLTAGVTYLVEQSTTSDFSATKVVFSGKAKSMVLSGRSSGRYYYRVKAIKSGYLDSAWMTDRAGCQVP